MAIQVDGLEQARPRRSVNWRVPHPVGLGALGFVLLWWADAQMQAFRLIFGSTFQYPVARGFLFSLTFVAAGLAFGLALTLGAKIAASRRAVWFVLVIALVILSWGHLWIMGMIPSVRLLSFHVFATSQMGLISVIVGFLISGLIGPTIGQTSSKVQA